MSMFTAHSEVSSAVRCWRPTRATETSTELFDLERESFSLIFPGTGHTICVTFTVIEGHPDVMRAHSTNWRCEHEPNGIFFKNDCRNFYRRLKQLGCVERK